METGEEIQFDVQKIQTGRRGRSALALYYSNAGMSTGMPPLMAD